jgi:hypothetical protein
MVKPSTTKYEVPENFGLIEFGYSQALILPFADGIQFMDAIKNAEMLENRYSSDKMKIVPLSMDTIKITSLSKKEYLDIKTAQLLGVTYREFKDAQSTATTSSS